MNKSFDEGYARYLSFLEKLDSTDDISEKNLLFRQLTQQLSDLEKKLDSSRFSLENEELSADDADLNYWI